MVRAILSIVKVQLVFVILVACGCGDGSTRHSSNPIGPDGEAKITQMASASGGDFSKLSAADKEYLTKRNGGNVAAAEAELKKYASGY